MIQIKNKLTSFCSSWAWWLGVHAAAWYVPPSKPCYDIGTLPFWREKKKIKKNMIFLLFFISTPPFVFLPSLHSFSFPLISVLVLKISSYKLWSPQILSFSLFTPQIRSDQIISVAQSCPTLWNPINGSTPGLPVHHQLPEFTQTHAHWVSDAIQPSHPLSSPFPPALNASQLQGLFKWVSSSHQVAKVLEFQLQHQSFQWTPRTYLLQDGLVGSPCSKGTLKSLLQHHCSKASIFRCSAFFTVQLSHPYMTTGKTRALTRQTFVGKVMSLLFNMLSSLVITFLPRSKHLLISWLQSPSAVILEPPKKVWHCFHCLPIYFP